MKNFTKNIAVTTIWVYLLVCLAPFHPCYGMDKEERGQTRPTVTHRGPHTSPSDTPPLDEPQKSGSFSTLRGAMNSVWDVVRENPLPTAAVVVLGGLFLTQNSFTSHLSAVASELARVVTSSEYTASAVAVSSPPFKNFPMTLPLVWHSLPQAMHYYTDGPCTKITLDILTPVRDCLRGGESLQSCRKLLPKSHKGSDSLSDAFIFKNHPFFNPRFKPLSIVQIYASGKICISASSTHKGKHTKLCFLNIQDPGNRTVESVTPSLDEKPAFKGFDLSDPSIDKTVRHIGVRASINLADQCGTFHQNHQNQAQPNWTCLLTSLRMPGTTFHICFDPLNMESLTLQNVIAFGFENTTNTNSKPFSFITWPKNKKDAPNTSKVWDMQGNPMPDYSGSQAEL